MDEGEFSERTTCMHLLIYASPFSMAGRNLRRKIQSLGVATQSTYLASVKALDRHL